MNANKARELTDRALERVLDVTPYMDSILNNIVQIAASGGSSWVFNMPKLRSGLSTYQIEQVRMSCIVKLRELGYTVDKDESGVTRILW